MSAPTPAEAIAAADKYIRSIARRFAGRGVPFDDLVQEGRLGLLRSLETYREDRGAKWLTYAWKFIGGAMKAAVRRAAKAPSRPSYEDGVADSISHDGGQTVEDLLQCRRDVESLRAAMKSLSERDRRLIALRFEDGLRWSQVAEALGIATATVQWRYGNILRRLKEVV
jgi:RNA polymerase sigma factor (sigma-70 family)